MRAVMNGVMQSETEMILAARAGLDTNRSPRFAKMKETIVSGVSYWCWHRPSRRQGQEVPANTDSASPSTGENSLPQQLTYASP